MAAFAARATCASTLSRDVIRPLYGIGASGDETAPDYYSSLLFAVYITFDISLPIPRIALPVDILLGIGPIPSGLTDAAKLPDSMAFTGRHVNAQLDGQRL